MREDKKNTTLYRLRKKGREGERERERENKRKFGSQLET